VLSVFAMAFWPPAATADGAAVPDGVSLRAPDDDCVVVADDVDVLVVADRVDVEVELAVVSAAPVTEADEASVVVVGAEVLSIVATGFAFPDTPDAAASIPLASINGYGLEPPPDRRDRSDARADVSTTAPDEDDFGAYCAGRPTVRSRGVAAATRVSSSIAAWSASVRTAAACDREPDGGSRNLPRGTNGTLAAIVMSWVRALTFSAGSRTSPRGSEM